MKKNNLGGFIVSKFLRVLLVLVVSVMFSCFTMNAEAAKKKVAVMPFENVSGGTWWSGWSGWDEHRVAEIMTEQVTNTLVNSGKYTVVERNQLGKVINELNFQQSGMVNPAQVIQFGQMSGTDYSIMGKITMAAVTGNSTKQVVGLFSGIGGQLAADYKGVIEMNVRFVDNKTGEIFKSETIKASAADNNGEIAYSLACNKAAEIILRKFQGPLGATIIDSDGTTVYIDKGADEGIKVGDTLIVFKEGAPITTPSGKVIVKKIPIGKIKVTEVDTDYSICKITDGGAAVTKNAKVGRPRKN